MKRDLQITLVEQSRYHARLMTGELSERFPSASISVFSCAQAALDELRRGSPDIAIIAQDLPDTDGSGFVQFIRTENDNLPIIAIGADPLDGTPSEATKAGADLYLPRDSSLPSALPAAIEELISRPVSDAKKLGSGEKLKLKEQADLIRVTAGTLYHEINNPLMTILGMTELILNNGYECDREVARKLKIVRRSARRIQSALSRLSTMSRPMIKQTPSGRLIDPKQSRVATKSPG